MLYASIIENTDDAIISKNLDGIVTSWNAAAIRMFGYSSEEIIGKSIGILIPDELKNEEFEFLKKIRNGEHIRHFETLRKRKDGNLINVSVNLSPVLDENGKVFGASKIARDITLQKKRENALIETEKTFRYILENSPIAVRISSKSTGQVVFANPNYYKLIDRTKNQALAVDPRQFYANPQDYDKVLEDLKYGKPVLNRLFKLKNFNKIKWALVSFINIDFEGETAILGWLYDITDRKLLEDQAIELAFHDALTQLPNRRLFDDRIKLAIATKKRTGIYGAILFLDLDNFKPLNDLHGHVVGDLLLIEVAHRICNCVRKIDTVARFGGDEFVVMLTELDADEEKSREVAFNVATKISASLAKTYFINYHHHDSTEVCLEHHCSASIGVTLFNGDDELNLDEIIKCADEAMYQAKKYGRNSIRFTK